MNRILAIDIETFSDVDLIKCGVYAYADSPAFEVLLFAWSFDEEETQIADLAQGGVIPDDVVEAILDNGVIKTAFNANFERVCLGRYLETYLPPVSWAMQCRPGRPACPAQILRGRRCGSRTG